MDATTTTTTRGRFGPLGLWARRVGVLVAAALAACGGDDDARDVGGAGDVMDAQVELERPIEDTSSTDDATETEEIALEIADDDAEEVEGLDDVVEISDVIADSSPERDGADVLEDVAVTPDDTGDTSPVTDTTIVDEVDTVVFACERDDECDDGNACTEDRCRPGIGCTIGSVIEGCAGAAPPTEPQYVGVWSVASNDRRVLRDQSWDELVGTWETWAGEGWRLVDLEPRVDGQTVRYDALFEERGGGYALYVSSDAPAFDAQLEASSNLRLADYETFRVGSVRYQAAVWLGAGGSELHRDLGWDELIATRDAREAAGMRIVDLEIDSGDGREGGESYSVLMYPGNEPSYLWVGPRWDAFASKVAELDDLRLVDIEVYGDGAEVRYAGVWWGNDRFGRVVGGQPWSRFQALDQQHRRHGLRLIDLERFDGLPVTPVAWAAEIHDRVHQTTVGYAHALARDGVIIGYGGHGYARALWEPSGRAVPYTPDRRSHLASISKVITATAMKTSGIDLDRPFHELLADQYPIAGEGVGAVTVRNLLTHRSGMNPLGLDGGRCGPDFAGTIAALVAADVLREPGHYRYSNTNYCLARAVLEAYTGQDYVTWVNEHMFHPMGIREASAAPDASLPTLYYHHENGIIPPNGGYLWTTDYSAEAGAYGWYASSAGLIRWLIGLRNNVVLGPSDTAALFGENLGWLNGSSSRGALSWHNGAWITGDGRGLHVCLTRLPDGYDAVIFLNTSPNSALNALGEAFEALVADEP